MFKLKNIISILLLAILLTQSAITFADDAEDALTGDDETLTYQCKDYDPTKSGYSFTQFISDAVGSKISDFNPNTARVVELSESLSSETSTTATSNSIIVSAYKGFCCKDAPVDGKCTSEIIDSYSSTLSGCQTIANFCTPIQLIISTSGINLLKFYAMQIYKWAASLVGIICVLLIVISGIQITASRGEDISSAKNRLTQALAGLALLFLSALILYTINPTFFTT